mgnify:CR=1 FL=1
MQKVPNSDGTVERLATGDGAKLATKNSRGSLMTVRPGSWTANHSPSAATQATTTKTAAAGTYHVCTSITATIACDSTVQTPIRVYLRNGATGAGTIMWSAAVAAPANGIGGVAFSDLNIVGSVNTAMTLEFSGAGVTGSLQDVTLGGYSAT